MENKKLNETESIELIIQMIRNTRRNIVVGGGNQFIVWGLVDDKIQIYAVKHLIYK